MQNTLNIDLKDKERMYRRTRNYFPLHVESCVIRRSAKPRFA